MHKISLQNAVKMTGKSESTIRRDVKKGKVSAARDERGHLRFDIAELQRAYGELKSTGTDDKPTETDNHKPMTEHDRAENYRDKGQSDRRFTIPIRACRIARGYADGREREVIGVGISVASAKRSLIASGGSGEKAELGSQGYWVRPEIHRIACTPFDNPFV